MSRVEDGDETIQVRKEEHGVRANDAETYENGKVALHTEGGEDTDDRKEENIVDEISLAASLTLSKEVEDFNEKSHQGDSSFVIHLRRGRRKLNEIAQPWRRGRFSWETELRVYRLPV